ncbi:MAG: TIGR04283 family arsenosugar biosynthesis glycosyltransferase [Saprospiraceae bacterium]|nr:TIGR04283 family arsenosugar biosynthesis glycosyltransferase [Saprospiraceae bacterium]
MNLNSISIIIPTLNEEERIGQLVTHLRALSHQTFLREIIVSDGGSADKTCELASAAGAQLLHAPCPSRATQMNYGAQQAQGDILYFVHADALPPKDCLRNIIEAVQAGHQLGCFSYDFDSDSSLLKINAYMTQFDAITSGGGDQTLFLPKETFEALGRFNEELPIMEDFDFVWRAKQQYPLHFVKNPVLVSARKYEKNSYLKVQIVNGITFTLFRRGYCPFKLAKWYKRVLS